MDSSEKVGEAQENELIDCSIVKEEYEFNEISVPVVPVERIPGDFPENSEVVTFEIIEVEQKKKYKCSLCETRVSTPSNLKQHMLTHSNIKNFECSHCSKAFKENRFLERHLKTHIKQEPVKCDICNKTIKNSWGLKNHKRTQHINIINGKCHICGKVVTTKRNLRDHIRRTHEGDGAKEQKPLICPICGKQCQFKHNLQLHVKSHSTTNKCNICFRIFATRGELNCHMRNHKLPPGKSFVCEICNKVFKTKYYLTYHQKIHLPEEEDPVKCIYCSKIFGKVYALQLHMKKDHRGLPKKIGADPKCTICQKDCKSIEDLKKHIENLHGRKNHFECAICGLKTYKKSIIAQHLMTVHFKMIGVKYFKVCPICSKRCYSQSLQRHMRTHSEEKISCDLCNNTFKSVEYVRRHKRLHCDVIRGFLPVC